ncbi:MAG: hypothetical protein H0T88_03020 [Lysobacter sp.]|nr:hypothetical protein [Lysobacter sp.]
MDGPMDAALSSTTLRRNPMAAGIGSESRHASMAWAVGQALLLHAVVLALLIAGLSGSPDAPAPGARGTINVDLIASSSLSAAMQHTLSPPIPQPTPVEAAPPPEPALPEPLAEPETPAEPSVAETIIPQAQTAGGETGSTAAGEALQANPDLSAQAFSDRRLRVLAIRRANRASQTFPVARTAAGTPHRQPARVSGSPQARVPGSAQARVSGSAQASTPATPPEPVGITLDATWRSSIGTDADSERLLAAYEEHLQASLLPNWLIPDDVPFDQPCLVTIKQSPQGEVLQVLVDELCPFQEDAKASIHDALLASQPLPYEGFEALPIQTLSLVFQRHAP